MADLISRQDVEHVAKLARLALTEAEKETYSKQLSALIGYFSQLQELNTEGVEPLAQPLPIYNVMRSDEIVAPPGHETLLANAPEQENGYFRVPKIGK